MEENETIAHALGCTNNIICRAVHKSIKDNDYYVLTKNSYNNGNSYYNCLLNLRTMCSHRMCNLTAVKEFIKVDYCFTVNSK